MCQKSLSDVQSARNNYIDSEKSKYRFHHETQAQSDMSSHDSNYSKKGRASSRLRKLRVRYEKPLDFDPFLEESSYSSPSTMCDVHQRLTSEVRITGVCYDKGRNVWLGHWHENNKPFRKSFSVVKHGYDGARSKAIKWRRDRENGIPYVRPKGACGKYKGVCYNEAQKGWRASWCKDGKEHCKYFSVAKHGHEGAREKAIQWRRDRESGIPIEKPARRTCDEVKGVCYDILGKRWQASWSKGGKRISKRFPVAEYGQEGAKQMAIQWRKSREAEVLLVKGCKIEVHWSRTHHKTAGYERPAAWYPATIERVNERSVTVRYLVGKNEHFRCLDKNNFGAPYTGDNLVFRIATGNVNVRSSPGSSRKEKRRRNSDSPHNKTPKNVRQRTAQEPITRFHLKRFKSEISTPSSGCGGYGNSKTIKRDDTLRNQIRHDCTELVDFAKEEEPEQELKIAARLLSLLASS